MNQDAPLAEVAHVIQLAVAPVFLLTGIGALLGVLASRLARTVDRARELEKKLMTAPPGRALVIRESLRQQSKRARLTLGCWGQVSGGGELARRRSAVQLLFPRHDRG